MMDFEPPFEPVTRAERVIARAAICSVVLSAVGAVLFVLFLLWRGVTA